MQEIEIRRPAMEAEAVRSFQVNPAVMAGTNGEPDSVVVAFEVSTADGNDYTLMLGREEARQARDALDRAWQLAQLVTEDLA